MDPRLFGEFMGTLILVLIGNGVVANVVLKKTLGSAAGWLTIVFGYGLGVMAGVFVAIACGSGDAHINPAVTLGIRRFFRGLLQVLPLPDRSDAGWLRGRRAGVDSLHAALGRDSRCRLETRLLLHRACHSEYGREPDQRNHRDVSAGADHRVHRQDGSGARIGAVPGGRDGVGHRFRLGRHHWIRHQSGPRSWARASLTPSCRSPERAARISVTASPFRCWAG